MTERQQARLLEQYILTLHTSLNVQPPQALDSEMAQFAHQWVMSGHASTLDDVTRSRIWEQALASVNDKEQARMIQTQIQTKHHFSSTWGVMVVLLLIVGTVGGLMMFNLNNRDPNNYLSVYPLATQTETFSDLDHTYLTATVFIEKATQEAIATMLGTAILEPTFMATLPPDGYVLATSTPPGMLRQDQAELINAQCQYIDLLSAECAYRLGRQFRAFGFEGYIPIAKDYFRKAYDLEPDNDEYRYGLAQILFETGDCVESKQLLMPDILNDESVGHDVLQILAQYAVACQDEIELSSGLQIIYPTIISATATPFASPTALSVTLVPPLGSTDELNFSDLCMNVPLNSAECFYLKSQFVYWINGEQHSDESITYLEQASFYAPDSLAYRYHLALALAETGQCESSKRLLLMQDIDERVMPVVGQFIESCGILPIPDDIKIFASSQMMPIDESPVTPVITATPILTPVTSISTPAPTMMLIATATATPTPSN